MSSGLSESSHDHPSGSAPPLSIGRNPTKLVFSLSVNQTLPEPLQILLQSFTVIAEVITWSHFCLQEPAPVDIVR
jgi:hypothetical protein